MSDVTNDEVSQISKFNDATLSISRLNDSWVLCKVLIRRGSLQQWKVELDNIWLELYPDVLRSKDKDDLIKDNKTLIKGISKSKNRNNLYRTLYKRHEFLRKIQDLSGKGGSYRDEDDLLWE